MVGVARASASATMRTEASTGRPVVRGAVGCPGAWSNRTPSRVTGSVRCGAERNQAVQRQRVWPGRLHHHAREQVQLPGQAAKSYRPSRGSSREQER